MDNKYLLAKLKHEKKYKEDRGRQKCRDTPKVYVDAVRKAKAQQKLNVARSTTRVLQLPC